MTEPHATGTAARPDEDHPAPGARPRSSARRAWFLTGLVVVAVVTVIVAVSIASDDEPALDDDRAVAPVVVDGQDPVQLDGGTVTTPCFSYRVPEDLELAARSAGCSTAVGFGSDSLTRIMVMAQTDVTEDSIEDGAEGLRRAVVDAGGDATIDTVTAGGRDALRIRSVDAWGLRRTSYMVPLPTGRFTQAGKDLAIIWLTSPASPEFDRWMATVLDSLEIPGS